MNLEDLHPANNKEWIDGKGLNKEEKFEKREQLNLAVR